MIRICRHCGEEYETIGHGHAREYCFKKECLDAELTRLSELRKRLIKDWKKKQKKRVKPLCTNCHVRPIMKGNKFLCDVCFREASEEIEIYSGWGVDCETTARRKRH